MRVTLALLSSPHLCGGREGQGGRRAEEFIYKAPPVGACATIQVCMIEAWQFLIDEGHVHVWSYIGE